MQTNVRTPTDVFNLPQRLQVPLFQRPYVWSQEKQWEPLWRDVERIATRILRKSTALQPHFLGAVVIQQIQNSMGDLQTRIVIDGQQRLTTLQIMLDAVHAVFQEQGFADAASRLEFLVENAKAYRRKPEDQFKILPTNRDRAAFNEVMGKVPPIAYDQLQHRDAKLVRAHRFFYEQTQEWFRQEGQESLVERADALELAISRNLQLVVIDLQVDENAQEIFETLNARGTPLTPVDLIKNFVFQRLSEEGETVESIYHDYWECYETDFWEQEILSGRLNRPRAVVFVNHWLFSMLGEDVSSGEVFTVFKRFLIDRPHLTTLALVKRLHRAALLYQDLTQKGAMGQGEVDRVALFAYRMEAMQTDVVKPLLLALLDPDREATVPQQAMEQILDDVESWLVRRMLVRVTSKNYNRTMADLINIVRDAPVEEVHHKVRDYLQRQRGDSSHWPDDAMVRQSLSTTPIYKRLSRARMRMVLEAIEDHLRGYGTGKHGLTGVRTPRGMYTIEHLMPQAWEANWDAPADGDADMRSERIHTLGNLTLVTQALNSKVSNAAWDVKSVELNRHGVVLMNNRLTDFIQGGWTDAAIEQRTAVLTDIILSIWKVPDGHVIHTMVDADATGGRTTIADLMRAGLLHAGDVLVPAWPSLSGARVVVRQDGALMLNDAPYYSPSAAGSALRDGKATNGWSFWKLEGGDGATLDDLRSRLMGEDVEEESSGEASDEDAEVSESMRDTQLRFWQGFADHVRDCDASFAPKMPRRQSWMSIAIGHSSAHVDAIFTSSIGSMVGMRPNETGPELRVDFYIYDNDDFYQRMLLQQTDIEEAYGAPLRFYAAPGVTSRRIFDFLKTDIFDESRWPEYYDWLTERIIRLREVMGKRL